MISPKSKEPVPLLDSDEKHFIIRTQQGDAEAFTPLVRKYHLKLYAYIFGRVKNAETAKDLTQDTWLKAFRGIHTFRGDSAFTSWIYRIAENVCIDFFRKQKIRNDIEPLHVVDERRLTDTYPSPCQYIERQELRVYLRAGIHGLTQTRKRVFLLYYAQDLSIKQIATRLKKSEGTIKSHLRNARHQLRAFLTPYLENQQIPFKIPMLSND